MVVEPICGSAGFVGVTDLLVLFLCLGVRLSGVAAVSWAWRLDLRSPNTCCSEGRSVSQAPAAMRGLVGVIIVGFFFLWSVCGFMVFRPLGLFTAPLPFSPALEQASVHPGFLPAQTCETAVSAASFILLILYCFCFEVWFCFLCPLCLRKSLRLASLAAGWGKRVRCSVAGGSSSDGGEMRPTNGDRNAFE